MSYNISKELIEFILGYKIKSDYLFGEYAYFNSKTFSFAPENSDNIGKNCNWRRDSKSYNYITYNDFFFMCKDWALKQNISMYSYLHELNGGVEIVPKKKCDWLDNKRFKAESEQQAVFDACQWIIENKGN